MPAKQRPSFLKRQKEMARLQKQREKSAKRLARKQERGMGAAAEVAVDPAPGLESTEAV
jgi:hypothetical protein